MPYCSNCGERVEADASFCASCGTSLEDEQGRSTATTDDKPPTGHSQSTGHEQSTTHSQSADDWPNTEQRQTAPTGGGWSMGSGFTAGLLAFVAGYAVTWVVKSGETSEAFSQFSSLGLDAAPETWQGVGWFFMTMHNVSVEFSASAAGQSMSQSIGSGAIEQQWLLVVPALALVTAGYYVAKETHPGTSGVAAGASVVAGYVVCTVALAFLSTWTVSTTTFGQTLSISMGPKLIEAVAIAGVGYPVVLGGIGGALADS